MTTVKPNFFTCLMRLQDKNKKIYSWAEIGDAIGMSRQAAQSLFMAETTDNSFLRYGTFGRLVDFFATEGLPVAPNDLFVIDDSDASLSNQ